MTKEIEEFNFSALAEFTGELSKQFEGSLLEYTKQTQKVDHVDNEITEVLAKSTIDRKFLENKLRDGFREVTTLLNEHPAWLTPLQRDELLAEMKKAAEQTDQNVIIRALSEGLSLGEGLGFTSDGFDRLYLIASHFFEAGELDRASKVFWLLCILDPDIGAYWYCLGLSKQKEESWDAALDAYAISTIVNPFAPLPLIRTAECYEAINDIPQAKAALDMAIEIADEQGDEFESVKKEALFKKSRF